MIWRYNWSSALLHTTEAVVKLKLYHDWEWEWGPNQTWMFLGFNVTTSLGCEHKWDDRSYLHYSPQFKYMNLLVFFTFYGYITKLQSGQLPVGFQTLIPWLMRSTPARVVRVRALAGDIVSCSWARHFTLTMPLSTQVYKWVPANLMLGGNPAMD